MLFHSPVEFSGNSNRNFWSNGKRPIFLTVVFCILKLIVEAKVLNTDLEHNSLSSEVPVFINVRDVDDNSPRFVQRSYR